jgi:dihydrofolate reductase
MLYGRTTYELMEDHWPAVARDEKAPRAGRAWARTLEAMPKYVVSASRRDFPWNNTFPVEGETWARR